MIPNKDYEMLQRSCKSFRNTDSVFQRFLAKFSNNHHQKFLPLEPKLDSRKEQVDRRLIYDQSVKGTYN